MAFSIKQIKAILSEHNLPVDELEKTAEEICSRHTADLDSIKEERDKYKKDSETLESTKEELEKLKKDPFEVKYTALKEEFDKYKTDIETEKTKKATTAAYRDLLKKAGVSEKRIDAVLRVSDISNVKLDKDGKIEGADDLEKSIKTEWADFITSDGKQGADVADPPGNNGGNGGASSRAAQLYKQHYETLYGKGESK